MNFKWKYEKFIRTISWSPFFIHRRKVQKVIYFCCHKVCLFGYFCFPLHEKEVNFNKTLLILELHRQCGRDGIQKKSIKSILKIKLCILHILRVKVLKVLKLLSCLFWHFVIWYPILSTIHWMVHHIADPIWQTPQEIRKQLIKDLCRHRTFFRFLSFWDNAYCHQLFK